MNYDNSCYPGISVFVFLKKADLTKDEFPKARFTCPVCIVAGVSKEYAERSVSEGFVPRAKTKIGKIIEILKKEKFIAPKRAPVRTLICKHCHDSGF